MSFSPRIVANYFIEARKRRKEKPPTPMELLKLVYIAHGWNLAIHDEPLITDTIQAWKYGPVFPSLYRAVREWGNQPVEKPLLVSYGDDSDFSPEEEKIMDLILETYGHFDGIQLSMLTHASGTPWHKVYIVEKDDTGDAPIPNKLIKQHFIDLANRKTHVDS